MPSPDCRGAELYVRQPLGVVFIQLPVAGAAVDGVTPKSWNTGYEHFLEYFMEENAWFAPYKKFDEKVAEIKGGFFKMKKALAILLAIGMVFAVFADAPVVSNSVVEFKGAASLEWISDLDAETNGFKNTTEANLKIDIVSAGDAATSGDGIWGELKIKVDGTTVDNGAVKVTKDTAADAQEYIKDTFFVGYALNDDGKYDVTINNKWAYPAASVETAKIHFVDGDVGIALNILAPDLNLGKASVPTATGATFETVESGDALEAGFALEITSSVIDANFKVKDNGEAKAKEWGFAADATVKAVENMNLRAAFAFANDKTALRFGADYKLGINDTLYVKPAVDFTKNYNDGKALVAGALLGWGTEGQEPGFFFVSNKCADGFSVAFSTDMADPAVNKIAFGIYDSTLLAGLKVGADYVAKLDEFGKGTLQADVKYGTDIDILSIALAFGYQGNFATETNTCKYSVEVSTDDVIDNTNLYAKYEGQSEKSGKITVGAKIAL